MPEKPKDYKKEYIERQKIIISYLENRIEKLERCLHEWRESDCD